MSVAPHAPAAVPRPPALDGDAERLRIALAGVRHQLSLTRMALDGFIVTLSDVEPARARASRPQPPAALSGHLIPPTAPER